MTKSEILKKYATAERTVILISEVTRMSRGQYCVAGLDLRSQLMMRPLRGDGKNWTLGTDRSVFGVGNLLQCNPTGVRGTVLPHATEDTRLASVPTMLEHLPEDLAYALLLEPAYESVAAAIGQIPIDNKYVIDGARCRSLGGVRAKRRQVQFDGSRGALRLLLDDSDGRSYDLKVTCDWLQHYFSPSDVGAELGFGVDEANEWLKVNPPNETLILRVGLARPWDGNQNAWHPLRCYLQLNGMICPQDNYHIFGGLSGA
jgi:hypothetical protein